MGSLPKVVEISNTSAPQSEATPCSIQGQALGRDRFEGPIVADEIAWPDKVTVSAATCARA